MIQPSTTTNSHAPAPSVPRMVPWPVCPVNSATVGGPQHAVSSNRPAPTTTSFPSAPAAHPR
jgi:hypothetical protein